MKSVSVSIVSYFSDADALTTTVRSLAHAARVGNCAVRLVLVDNTDQAADGERLARLLRQWVDDALLTGLTAIEFRHSDHNIGYGRANNLALMSSSQDLVLVLNPDVELAPDALSKALDYMNGNPGCVLLSPRAFDPDGADLYLNHRQPSVLALLGRALPGLRRFAPIGRATANYEIRDRDAASAHLETVCASGCFMLMRRAAFVRSGGFDPAFFMYFEDYDLSVRLRAMGELAYRPEVTVIHLGGGAAGKGLSHRKMFIASALRYFKRHGWRWA